jgi:hypothetical protein
LTRWAGIDDWLGGTLRQTFLPSTSFYSLPCQVGLSVHEVPPPRPENGMTKEHNSSGIILENSKYQIRKYRIKTRTLTSIPKQDFAVGRETENWQ